MASIPGFRYMPKTQLGKLTLKAAQVFGVGANGAINAISGRIADSIADGIFEALG